MLSAIFLSLIFLEFASGEIESSNRRPNIVVIIADDMGWNDASFHGSNEIPTPNLDALAFNGVILNRHYALPTCSPSRAAFLTGRHPMRMGMQGLPINLGETRGIPLNETLLPEHLKRLGYVTRLVGKWHVGYYTDKHTPTRRGFDSFLGYYGGVIKYFTHRVTKNKHTGYDFHRDDWSKKRVLHEDHYFTDLITEEAEHLIQDHDPTDGPLFLQVAHLANHASENSERLEVRDVAENDKTFSHISELNRRRYAGMMTAMDESTGRIVRALDEANMLENTVIIFFADNGAPSGSLAPYANYGSNMPLRGAKATNFEGAVRVPALIFSPLIKDNRRNSVQYMHMTDWLPTIYCGLGGGNITDLGEIDGMDQWSAINNASEVKRTALLINIDEVFDQEAAIVGNIKYISGPRSASILTLDGAARYTNYYGYAKNENETKYNLTRISSSLAGEAIKKLKNFDAVKDREILKLREEGELKCEHIPGPIDCTDACVYNVKNDPCETTNLAKDPKLAVMIDMIKKYIENYRTSLVEQTNSGIDPASFPENFGGYWMPWLQEEVTHPKRSNATVYELFCEGYPVDNPLNCL